MFKIQSFCFLVGVWFCIITVDSASILAQNLPTIPIGAGELINIPSKVISQVGSPVGALPKKLPFPGLNQLPPVPGFSSFSTAVNSPASSISKSLSPFVGPSTLIRYLPSVSYFETDINPEVLKKTKNYSPFNQISKDLTSSFIPSKSFAAPTRDIPAIISAPAVTTAAPTAPQVEEKTVAVASVSNSPVTESTTAQPTPEITSTPGNESSTSTTSSVSAT